MAKQNCRHRRRRRDTKSCFYLPGKKSKALLGFAWFDCPPATVRFFLFPIHDLSHRLRFRGQPSRRALSTKESTVTQTTIKTEESLAHIRPTKMCSLFRKPLFLYSNLSALCLNLEQRDKSREESVSSTGPGARMSQAVPEVSFFFIFRVWRDKRLEFFFFLSVWLLMLPSPRFLI